MRARPFPALPAAVLALVLASIVLLLVVPGVARAVGRHDGEPTVVYVVRPGDTLWTIARRADPGADPRPLVDRLVEVNDLRGTLHAGDQLQLPAHLAPALAAG